MSMPQSLYRLASISATAMARRARGDIHPRDVAMMIQQRYDPDRVYSWDEWRSLAWAAVRGVRFARRVNARLTHLSRWTRGTDGTPVRVV